MNGMYLGRLLLNMQKGIIESVDTRLLLDLYPSAAAAYSLRKLRNSYSGPAIRVRRDSDNTEQDIYFNNRDLDESGLTAFVGSNSGYITKWYDQSGNANDGIQTTAANQPRIIESGTITKVNNKSALKFPDGSRGFSISPVSSAYPWSFFSVHKRFQTTNTLITLINYTNNAPYSFLHYTNSIIYITDQIRLSQVSNSDITQVLASVFTNSSNINFYKNGSNITLSTSSSTQTYNFDSIGRSSSYSSVGWIQEIVFYSSDNSSNRASIEYNINSYFSIY